MKLNKVYVWVPTKGWKKIYKSYSRSLAQKFAQSLQPLEVKLIRDDGETFYGGRLCEVNYNVPEGIGFAKVI